MTRRFWLSLDIKELASRVWKASLINFQLDASLGHLVSSPPKFPMRDSLAIKVQKQSETVWCYGTETYLRPEIELSASITLVSACLC